MLGDGCALVPVTIINHVTNVPPAVQMGDDVADQPIDLSLYLMTVPDVADPQAADIHQTRDLVAHRLINVTQ
jgi:hypothetical protein